VEFSSILLIDVASLEAEYLVII